MSCLRQDEGASMKSSDATLMTTGFLSLKMIDHRNDHYDLVEVKQKGVLPVTGITRQTYISHL